MARERLVLGYHGCDESVAARLLAGSEFLQSSNGYDWLGTGAYFWEYGEGRAWEWAEERHRRLAARGEDVPAPAVVGAEIVLGNCFDLADVPFTRVISGLYPAWVAAQEASGLGLPANRGSAPFNKLRYRDCAVIDWCVNQLARDGLEFDTVRGAFIEGEPVFAESAIYSHAHVQVAVRRPGCLRTTFRSTRKS